LANGKAPPVLSTSEKLLLNVEGLIDARTTLADFFSILLETQETGVYNATEGEASVLLVE
jgi:hypothetical protein